VHTGKSIKKSCLKPSKRLSLVPDEVRRCVREKCYTRLRCPLQIFFWGVLLVNEKRSGIFQKNILDTVYVMLFQFFNEKGMIFQMAAVRTRTCQAWTRKPA
jgi:hypothetical protein